MGLCLTSQPISSNPERPQLCPRERSAQPLSDLPGPAGGALRHGGRVGHVVVQVEESPSADQVAVVEADGEDLGDAAQQGALRPALTLDPAAENVPKETTKGPIWRDEASLDHRGIMGFVGLADSLVLTGDVGAVAQLTTVSIFVSLLVDGGEAHRRGTAGIWRQNQNQPGSDGGTLLKLTKLTN